MSGVRLSLRPKQNTRGHHPVIFWYPLINGVGPERASGSHAGSFIQVWLHYLPRTCEVEDRLTELLSDSIGARGQGRQGVKRKAGVVPVGVRVRWLRSAGRFAG